MAETLLDENGWLLAIPEPTNRIPPGHVAFEEGGLIIWAGLKEDIEEAPARVAFVDWFRDKNTRYLIGAYV